MKQKIQVVINPFPNSAFRHGAKIEVEADVKAGIAIQRKLDANLHGKPYRLIHVLSGISLAGTDTWRKAQRRQAWLIQQEVNGVRMADLPACELLRLAPLLAEQYAQEFVSDRDHKKFTSEVVKNARLIGDLVDCPMGATHDPA